jgi:hypothetical protein
MANYCPECGAAVTGLAFCSECGEPLTETGDFDEPVVLSHDDQVAILESAIAEYGKHGWHEWAPRPTPYETSLRRKSGLFAREFMAVWVEDDGTIMENYVGEGGRLF